MDGLSALGIFFAGFFGGFGIFFAGIAALWAVAVWKARSNAAR
jgi:hypothetical protein